MASAPTLTTTEATRAAFASCLGGWRTLPQVSIDAAGEEIADSDRHGRCRNQRTNPDGREREAGTPIWKYSNEEELGETRQATSTGDRVLAVAVHGDCHDGIGELPSCVVVVEEELSIEDRVRKMGSFALAVGVRHVEPVVDQGVGEGARGGQVAMKDAGHVVRETPRVGAATVVHHRERVDVNVAVGQDAERRNDFLAEVLVLVVAPHDHKVRLELVECGPASREVVTQCASVHRRGGGAAVVGPLGAHGRRPVRGVLLLGGDVRICQSPAQ
jgi:hypothetical protein